MIYTDGKINAIAFIARSYILPSAKLREMEHCPGPREGNKLVTSFYSHLQLKYALVLYSSTCEKVSFTFFRSFGSSRLTKDPFQMLGC